MSATYQDGDTGIAFKIDIDHVYHKPTEEELRQARPCRICLIGTFLVFLIGLLVASIVLMVTTAKCNDGKGKRDEIPTRMQYQIYVEPFKDSNGNRVGDLKGVKSKLGYIKALSANSILLSGVIGTKDFSLSPNIGSKNDLQTLVLAAKEIKLDVFLQMNPSVTSTSGDWFKEKGNAMHGWFIWSNESNTNNWLTLNHEPAWHVSSEVSANKYYSYFGKDLPTLNLHKKEVVDAINDKIKSWLAVGIKGLVFTDVSRLTVDGVYKGDYNASLCNKDCLSSHHVLSSFYETVHTAGGELWVSPGTSAELTSKYLGSAEKPEADFVLSDHVARQVVFSAKKFNSTFSKLIAPPSANKVGWLFDGPRYHRLASRLSDSKAAKVISLLLLTLPNQVIPFYGDEKMLLNNNKGKSTSFMVFDNKEDDIRFRSSSSAAFQLEDVKLANAFSDLAKLRGIDGIFTGIPQVIHAGNTTLAITYMNNSIIAINFDENEVVQNLDTDVKKGKILFSLDENEVGMIQDFETFTFHPYSVVVAKIQES